MQAAAETFRPNPKLDTEQVITELGVGEALVSFLDEKGRPNMVERAFILPPASQIGPMTEAERSDIRGVSVVAGVYEKTVDRESAYEKLKGRTANSAAPASAQQNGARGDAAAAPAGSSLGGLLGGLLGGGGGSRRKDTVVEAIVKSAARSIGSSVGREIIRGVLGSILRK